METKLMLLDDLLSAGLQFSAGAKANDQAKIDHRNDVIRAQEEERKRRLAELGARYGSPAGQRLLGYAQRNQALQDATSQPVVQDWMPLVNAGMTAANAIYDESQRPRASAPAAPTGENVPGKNFSPAPGYKPPITSVADWQPVQNPDNAFANAARRFERKDSRDPTLHGWWNQ